jgi:DNA repair exonuclease SbcCD ATPase subunit
MQTNDLKRAIIELLKSDEAFRYTVLGLLGLEDIRSLLKRLAENMVELVEAQARTEARIAELAERTDARFAEVDARFAELAAAQARTEARIAELAERTDARFAEVDARFAELAAAQARTEARIAELAERTDARFAEVDARFAELAAAQARTEARIAELAESMVHLRREVGKLSANFGFTLEEIAVTKIPRLLSEAGIEVRRSNIKLRHMIRINGREVEVDLYVVGRDVINNRDITVIGEVKGRVDARDVKKFTNRFKGIEAFKFIFGHTIKRGAEDEASKSGVRLYATYS